MATLTRRPDLRVRLVLELHRRRRYPILALRRSRPRIPAAVGLGNSRAKAIASPVPGLLRCAHFPGTDLVVRRSSTARRLRSRARWLCWAPEFSAWLARSAANCSKQTDNLQQQSRPSGRLSFWSCRRSRLPFRFKHQVEWRLGGATKVLEPAFHHHFPHALLPACAPSASPTSCDIEAGVQIIVEAE